MFVGEPNNSTGYGWIFVKFEEWRILTTEQLSFI